MRPSHPCPQTPERGGLPRSLRHTAQLWGWRHYPVVIALFFGVMSYSSQAQAIVLYSRDAIPGLAFPNVQRVEQHTVFLSEEEGQHVTTLAKVPVEDRQVTLYTGYQDDQPIGYAFLQTQIARTLPATFLIVLSSTGVVQRLYVIAFHEPEEYIPSERWLKQFEQKTLTPDLRLRRGLHGIAGSTLSAQAATGAVRRALALFQVLIRDNPAADKGESR